MMFTLLEMIASQGRERSDSYLLAALPEVLCVDYRPQTLAAVDSSFIILVSCLSSDKTLKLKVITLQTGFFFFSSENIFFSDSTPWCEMNYILDRVSEKIMCGSKSNNHTVLPDV